MTPRTQFIRLLWKEYRQVRTFGLLLLGCGAAFSFAAFLFAPSIAGLTVIASVLAILFGVASAATGFSSEHENTTFLFQRCLPTSLRYVIGAKIGVAVIGSLLIFLTLWALVSARLVWAGRLWTSDSSLGNELAEGLSTLIEFLVFGTLLSLIERRPLVGLAKTVALVICIRWIGFTLDFFVFRGFLKVPDFPWPSLTWRFVSLAAGIALIIRLVKTWYADEPVRWLPQAIDRLKRREVATLFQAEKVHRGEWRRLFWLQYRVSIWPIAVLTVVGVLAAFASSHIPEYFVVLTVSMMFTGAVAFSAANQNRLALATIGARSSTIWWSQICLPLISGLTALGTIVAIIARWAKDNPIWDWDWRAGFCVGIFSGLAALAWGQLASIRCKSTLSAIGYASGLLIPACLWIAIAVLADAPFWFFVFPLIVYPSAESFLHARLFFLDEKPGKLWWPARICLFVSLALGLIAYRYYEIPGVSQQELDHALSVVPRMNEAQTARFRVLADSLTDREAFGPTDVHNQAELELAWKNNQRNWVADHSDIVDEILEGPYLTSLEIQTSKSSYEQDQIRIAIIEEFLMAALETALQEGDVELGERIIRKMPIDVVPTDTLRWCKLPKNDSQRIRRLAHQLQEAAIFERECKQQLLRRILLPHLHSTYDERFTQMGDSNWVSIAGHYLIDGINWNRSERFFIVETVRQLEETLQGFSPERMDQVRNRNQAKNTPKVLSPQELWTNHATIVALNRYWIVIDRLEGLRHQLALISWQMDHNGSLPNSLDELSNEYMPKTRFYPKGSNLVYISEPFAKAYEIEYPVSKHYFVFEFDGRTNRIEVPFKVLPDSQKLIDSTGRLPPMIVSSGLVFPLALPAEEPESNDNDVKQPSEEVAPVK